VLDAPVDAGNLPRVSESAARTTWQSGVVARWTCPRCERTFGAVGRQHVCEPGLTLREFLDDALPIAEPVVDRILGHLRSLDRHDELIVDPIPSVVLLKNGPVVCTVRSMRKWVAIGFTLDRKLDSPRLSRKVSSRGGRHDHVVNVTDPDEVDDELLAWVGEAFTGSEAAAPRGDPMVPADVDVFIEPPP
jgi:hypothetical protein